MYSEPAVRHTEGCAVRRLQLDIAEGAGAVDLSTIRCGSLSPPPRTMAVAEEFAESAAERERLREDNMNHELRFVELRSAICFACGLPEAISKYSIILSTQILSCSYSRLSSSILCMQSRKYYQACHLSPLITPDEIFENALFQSATKYNVGGQWRRSTGCACGPVGGISESA